jgi:hypothetical protein
MLPFLPLSLFLTFRRAELLAGFIDISPCTALRSLSLIRIHLGSLSHLVMPWVVNVLSQAPVQSLREISFTFSYIPSTGSLNGFDWDGVETLLGQEAFCGLTVVVVIFAWGFFVDLEAVGRIVREKLGNLKRRGIEEAFVQQRQTTSKILP